MSHELRTPLNAIIGFSEIISGQFFGALNNERYLDYSQDILRSGRHLLAVINSVLDLSKSESGKMQLDAKPVDMADVLRRLRRHDARAMRRRRPDLRGLRHTVIAAGRRRRQAAPDLPQSFVQRRQSSRKRAAPYRSAPPPRPAGVCVTVGDTGIGMSAADIEIAFQPFGQVDNRLERKYEGTGLGLPLTKALVDLHGGSMAIDSARGAGTRISVTLPRTPANIEFAEAV